MSEHTEHKEKVWDDAMAPQFVTVMAGLQGGSTREVMVTYPEAAFVDFGESAGKLPERAYALLPTTPHVNAPMDPAQAERIRLHQEANQRRRDEYDRRMREIAERSLHPAGRGK